MDAKIALLTFLILVHSHLQYSLSPHCHHLMQDGSTGGDGSGNAIVARNDGTKSGAPK